MPSRFCRVKNFDDAKAQTDENNQLHAPPCVYFGKKARNYCAKPEKHLVKFPTHVNFSVN
jgi:hypothetical protein